MMNLLLFLVQSCFAEGPYLLNENGPDPFTDISVLGISLTGPSYSIMNINVAGDLTVARASGLAGKIPCFLAGGQIGYCGGLLIPGTALCDACVAMP